MQNTQDCKQETDIKFDFKITPATSHFFTPLCSKTPQKSCLVLLFFNIFSFQSFLSVLCSVFCPHYVTRIVLAEVTNDLLLVKFTGKFSAIILCDPSVTMAHLITLFSSVHCLYLTSRIPHSYSYTSSSLLNNYFSVSCFLLFLIS